MRVLILEDDPAQLAVLECAVRDLFLEPVGLRSPDLALAELERAPVLAVIDLDMSPAPCAEHEVDDVPRRPATGQDVLLDEIETRAARRPRMWLHRVGSRVRLVGHGRRCYGLHLSA
jgi:hypothetical protein